MLIEVTYEYIMKTNDWTEAESQVDEFIARMK